MLNKFKQLWQPAKFQGRGKKKDYFEGWYFKNVDQSEQNIYSIIPGISLVKDKTLSHSFVQVLNGRNSKSYYYPFPLDAFRASDKFFEVQIDKNYFSSQKMVLDINQPDNVIKGELTYSNITPWPVHLLSPGAMGWYAFAPFMACYHGILSFNHRISGELVINGERLNFTGGKGYIEKDWGKSMPSSWLWLQSNHFSESREASLSVSVAHVPWLGRRFTGFIIGFWLSRKLYRFATYTNARITKLESDEKQVRLVVEDKFYRLEVSADITEGATLASPIFGEMKGRLIESIKSNVEATLTDKRNNLIIFQGQGRNTAIEVVGNIQELAPL